MPSLPCVLGAAPDYYEKLGISSQTIDLWENGLRTHPEEHSAWEWWYFDTHLENGAKLVIVFLTKDYASPNTGLRPRLLIQLDTPGGRKWDVLKDFRPQDFKASKERCDVSFTTPEGFVNFFRDDGTLENIEIVAQIQDLDVTVKLAGKAPAWRPKTGQIFYGQDENQYFAWLPSIPYGDVKATYRISGEDKVSVSGNGYHDHNWGNVPLFNVVNHWYWGRGQVGPYTFISADIVHERAYDDKAITVFMLSRDGKIVADDGERVTFTMENSNFDAATRRPVADIIRFEHKDGDVRYVLEYIRAETILRSYHVNTLSGLKWLLAKLVGYDGCFHRFSGKLKLTKYENGRLTEEFEEDALWELMWFGKVYDKPMC
ncbi:unnamed protein product [Clonostachys rosea]|uniref:Diels-Alderase C-terminal domain-containing protein n=1 Tax=Bionectria ochroleuca TaxID=29856 RepID=A0ABY6UBV6_BIOOC|nr:unnamed protein product [Clonostachys rosea]